MLCIMTAGSYLSLSFFLRALRIQFLTLTIILKRSNSLYVINTVYPPVCSWYIYVHVHPCTTSMYYIYVHGTVWYIYVHGTVWYSLVHLVQSGTSLYMYMVQSGTVWYSLVRLCTWYSLVHLCTLYILVHSCTRTSMYYIYVHGTVWYSLVHLVQSGTCTW